MTTLFSLRRGHSAAVYISGCRSTSDVDVVEEETHFSSASAQILISEIMVCNCDLEKMKQNIHDVQKSLSNIINILGKI
ncbi:hypothetical protein AB205_0161240 [Aquarana catesbeiana]|uniref:Uncharacterized protein n=1 Tax=Aquarana catesbeiana TaxID=8400 RepID=A0A2G9RW35_AQUCT|nr:hypothetical protein AB205_0161240 [Aquarana catesbeiana]